jgi:hypothetical protein
MAVAGIRQPVLVGVCNDNTYLTTTIIHQLKSLYLTRKKKQHKKEYRVKGEPPAHNGDFDDSIYNPSIGERFCMKRRCPSRLVERMDAHASYASARIFFGNFLNGSTTARPSCPSSYIL